MTNEMGSLLSEVLLDSLIKHALDLWIANSAKVEEVN